MNRMLVAATFAAMATAVFAQSDPIESRRALMKDSGKYVYGSLNKMARGEESYDQGTVDAAFVLLTDAAAKLPELFPEDSQAGGSESNFRASPKIWENKSDFDARLAKLAEVVAESRPKATSLDGLKAVYPTLRESCNSCHEEYRIRVR